MNNNMLQLTLREMRENLIAPRSLAVLGLVSLIFGLSGPFQTFELLELMPRLVYWTAICTLTYMAGWLAGGYVLRLVAPRTENIVWQIFASGSAAGLAVWPVVLIINLVTFGNDDGNGGGHWLGSGSLLIYCVLISITLSAVSTLVKGSAQEQIPAMPTTPKIVSRLPLNLRGNLISLSVQDHYVEVTTSGGAGLVHYRLSDAIDDCDGVIGLQIHRSHWVALTGIKSVFRRNGRVLVETIKGDVFPVSRTYLPKIKELGLL
ncbi:MAG: LytTR family DNA-binding domain-containing protein [Rhizobiaceae bacterium]